MTPAGSAGFGASMLAPVTPEPVSRFAFATTPAPDLSMIRPQVGQLINNKYRLAKLLGDGGMGSVFEAKHEALGNSVALKFLHPELARRQGLVQRFLQEAHVSSKIDSPHVVRVMDVDQTPEGLPFIVMEFLKGQSLQAHYEELFRQGRRVGYEEALGYAKQMLDGLEAAHEEGIVHRDLKPDNVMIVRGKRGESVIKLLDFGIAKLKINGELYKGLTRPGVIMGTPEYMAPEQVFSADMVDARADIFSCAVMFFEMLAGRRPVGGDEAHQIAAQYLAGSVAKLTDLAPHVPVALATVIQRAMSADPKERYETVIEFRSAMEPFLPDAPRVVRSSAAHISTPPPQVVGSPVAAMSAVSASGVADRHGPNKSSSLAGVSVGTTPRSGRDYDGEATEKVAEPYRGSNPPDLSNPGRNGAAAFSEANMPDFGSTQEGAPFYPGATEGYPAMENGAHSPRPGGTDVGALPATASYDDQGGPAYAPYAAPIGPSVRPPVYASPPRRKSKGLGVGSILLIGTLFAGAVVGGAFAYDSYGRSSKRDKEDTTKTVPLPKPNAATTATPEPEQVQPIPQPLPPTTPTPTPTPQTTTPKPGAGPGPGPKPNPTPSPFPTFIVPSSLPPIEIPGIPGFPGAQPQPQPQPQPDPEPKPGGRPKIPPLGQILRPPVTTPIKAETKQTEARRPILRKPTASKSAGSSVAPSNDSSSAPKHRPIVRAPR